MEGGSPTKGGTGQITGRIVLFGVCGAVRLARQGEGPGRPTPRRWNAQVDGIAPSTHPACDPGSPGRAKKCRLRLSESRLHAAPGAGVAEGLRLTADRWALSPDSLGYLKISIWDILRFRTGLRVSRKKSFLGYKQYEIHAV